MARNLRGELERGWGSEGEIPLLPAIGRWAGVGGSCVWGGEEKASTAISYLWGLSGFLNLILGGGFKALAYV